MLNKFQTYPFAKLEMLIAGIVPQKKVFKLTIGEPQFPTPQPIQDALKNSTDLLSKYPKSSGEGYLREAQIGFVKKRFGVELKNEEIIPTLGTREVLFNFPHFFLFDTQNPTIAYPNPFYQVYEGGAFGANAKIILMDMTEQNNFKPTLSKKELEQVDLVILNSPNNPTGRVLSLDELTEWVNLALEYDFVILSDECYSEIYQDTKPHSILEACMKADNKSFKNILCLNSISKRSCAPGLRSGFIAGDSEILKHYLLYRSYIGCAIPLPLQKASSVAWSLDSDEGRIKYAKNMQVAKKYFQDIQPYTFYVWLKVNNDLEFTKNLYREEGILVLPGSFLGRNGVGSDFVRIALVHELEDTKYALENINQHLKGYL